MKKIVLLTLFFILNFGSFAQPIMLNPIDRAEYLYSIDKYDEALNVLNDFISKNPNDMYALLGRSCILYAVDDYENALKDIEVVLINEPFNIKAYHFRGSIYEGLGNHEKAIEDENYVLEQAPTYPSGLNIRGMAYGKLGLYEEALNDFDTAISNAFIWNDIPDCYYLNRAYIYYYMKNYSASLSDIKEALSLNTTNPEFYALQSKIQRITGNLQDAIKSITKAISIDPNYYELYYIRIIEYLQNKQYKQAKKDLTYISSKMSEYSAYHSLLSAYYYLTGKTAEAHKEYNESVKLKSKETNSFTVVIQTNEIDDFLKNEILEEVDFN